MRRHLAAVMFTDLVGYTALVRRDESAGREARRVHRNAVEQAVAAHDGDLLQYFGDGSLSAFSSAVEATRAAIRIQREFFARPDTPLRIGIDLGDIAYDEQGAFGDAVNVASRLEAICAPGAVLVSGKVRTELAGQPDLSVASLGSVRLKGLDAPVPVFAIDVEGLKVPEAGGLAPVLSSPSQRHGSGDPPARVADVIHARLTQAGALETRFPAVEDGDLPRLPLVGREDDLAYLREAAAKVEREGSGRVVFLSGDRGAGKTRLAGELARRLVDDGWVLVSGRAYPMETGVPFAPFTNAFEAAFYGVSADSLSGLVPGAADQLATVIPSLSSPGSGASSPRGGSGGEARTQLFWGVSQLVASLARDRPLLLVLEDLQWADDSSIDLLHFLCRQAHRDPVLILGALCPGEADGDGALIRAIHSLKTLARANTRTLFPLGPREVGELLSSGFGLDPHAGDRLVGSLVERTGGNPFFLEAILRSLHDAGHLGPGRTGWRGGGMPGLPLPRTVRESIRMRLSRLSSEARTVATLASVIGGRVRHRALAAAGRDGGVEVLEGIRELTACGIISESEERGEVVYDFSHPLVPETLESGLPRAEARILHARIASNLEALYGESAPDHADELAYHFVRAGREVESQRAAHYLAAAGLRALDRHAFGEAVRYLEAVLGDSGASALGERAAAGPDLDRLTLLKALAKAHRGEGDHRAARIRWREALELAEASGSHSAASGLHRRIALSLFSSGDLAGAWAAFDSALQSAVGAGDELAEAACLVGRGVSRQHVGRSREAREDVERALEVARRIDDQGLVVRAERGLLLIRMWNGDFDGSREVGERLRAVADRIGNPILAFWSEWTLAAISGLRGDTKDLHRRVEELDRIALSVNSPSLHLWAAELSLEERWASGEWELGIGLGEQAVSLARSLEIHSVLPRLLVWLSLIYIGRGELGRAGELVDEAWETSGAEGAGRDGAVLNVHTVVPAHIGRTAYFLAREEWDRAIEVGRRGLAVADDAGYVVWAAHRLLPLLIEAHLYAGNLAEAEILGRRLRSFGEATDHGLARAWGTAGEGLVAWLKGDVEAGTHVMIRAAGMLEEIPLLFDAARLRRQVAGRLFDMGRRDAAVAELSHVHGIFTSLGAQRELRKTVGQFEEMDADPPGGLLGLEPAT